MGLVTSKKIQIIYFVISTKGEIFLQHVNSPYLEPDIFFNRYNNHVKEISAQ